MSGAKSVLGNLLAGVLWALTVGPAIGQTASAPLTFEVASVKLSGRDSRPSMSGGPGTADPERIDYRTVKLRTVLLVCCALQEMGLETPGWMNNEYYDLTAKVPHGATRQQAAEMMLNLLKERFRLRLHHELRQGDGYAFTIAKGGSRLKETAYPGSVLAPPSAIQYIDNDFPQIEPGYAGKGIRIYGGQVFITLRNQPIWEVLGLALMGMGVSATSTPFADETGLTSNYDVNLKFGWPSRDGDPPGGLSAADALERNLGVKVVKKRVTSDVIVVDSADRVPTDN